MEELNFHTVKDVTDYVYPRVNRFRQFQSHKEAVTNELRVIFAIDSPFLKIIVKDGTFATAFTTKMGKGRMKALKKLLLSIDRDYYKTIDFKCE